MPNRLTVVNDHDFDTLKIPFHTRYLPTTN